MQLLLLSLNGNMKDAIPTSRISERVSLRSVTEPDDDAFLEELYFSRREDLYGLFADPEQTRALLLIQQRAQAIGYKKEFPNATYEVITFDGQRAGRIVIDRSGGTMAIIDIALLPLFRNRGIGSLILDSILDECQRGKRQCRLSVAKTSQAIRLYLRKGFCTENEMETHFVMKWIPMEEI
jgi:ribosomal protein S18 acetylase RimI-like enzyme